PREVGRAQIHVEENFRRARIRRPRAQDDRLRRLRDWIRRREFAAIALKIFPIEGDALESVLMALLEVAGVCRRRFVARLVDERRFPLAVGTWQRSGSAAAGAPGGTGNRFGSLARAVGID